jgi:hypothetical protein
MTWLSVPADPKKLGNVFCYDPASPNEAAGSLVTPREKAASLEGMHCLGDCGPLTYMGRGVDHSAFQVCRTTVSRPDKNTPKLFILSQS